MDGSPRFARLSEDWLLRGWTDIPWALVHRSRGTVRRLSRDAFYVARCCDGRTNFHTPAFLPVHRAILDRLIECGVARECGPGEALHGQQAYRRAETPALRGIHWSVTARCNLRCRHCFMEAPAGRYRELSRQEALGLIDQFERANVPQVALTGGEPFVRADLPALLDRLAERCIGVTEIASNGVCITDQWLDRLARLGFQPLFRISFDGCGAHDRMRGVDGTESRVIEAVRRLRAAGFPVAIMTSLDRAAIADLSRTYELMKTLDVCEWCVGMPAEVGTWRHSDAGLSISEMTAACLDLAARWRDEGRPFGIWLWRFGRLAARSRDEDPPSAVVTLEQDPGERTDASGNAWNCVATHRAPYLLPDATLLPCGGYTDSPLAAGMPNLLVTDLVRAWRESEVRGVADLRQSDVAAANESCRTCEMFQRCGGGCRVQALRRTGHLMSKDPVMCALWKGGIMQRFHAVVGA